MKIKIHRGENQIGGNIVEIASRTTRVLLDIGTELEESKPPVLPNIEGLFEKVSYDALIISHYHTDHMGLIEHISPNIPVYIGENAYTIIKAIAHSSGKELTYSCDCFSAGCPFCVGDIKIRPFLADHSAFDAYMFLIEADGESVLYTGDFRANGRKSFDALLKHLPKGVDVLICEGTTLTRDGKENATEKSLEEKAAKFFREKKGPIFVLQAATNIDRLVTMYRAAKRSNRIFLEELYMAEIAKAAGINIPNPSEFEDVRVFMNRSYDSEHFRYKMLSAYGKKKIGISGIAKERFVMNVRGSMLRYMRSLHTKMDFSDGVLVYSMWEGYKDRNQMQVFLKACAEMGLDLVSIHTSGHADAIAIEKLVNAVQPKKIMPIHTKNALWFKKFDLRNKNQLYVKSSSDHMIKK